MERKEIRIQAGTSVPFHNGADYCIGTGRMGLALQREYQEQLALVQEEIGFAHIRGHGLFSDDMAIYQEYEEADGQKRAEYNFTYLDLVMDSYLRLGIRPFLELGFMPEKLASGRQTVFYWKGNVTPPSDYGAWRALVQATLRHLIGRYGAEEVTAWPVEVWNEPNLEGFWKDADREEYFKLFACTFAAVKEVDARFQVGGPAICGVQDELWIRSFLEFCRAEGISPDFVTRHHYTTQVPETAGHYGYAKLMPPEEGFANLESSRRIIDSFPEFRGLPMHLTEFNTSYIPNCPLHDTNRNAAYIAGQLARLGETSESYSYWTFGDIFEEFGVPFTPFHGGFGLVANGGIPKPTFWTFRFFKELQGVCVHRSQEAVIVRRPDGSYRGVVWNATLDGTGRGRELVFRLPMEGETYCLLTETVDEETCNPLKCWHDMGEPSSLSERQKKILREAARPLVQTRQEQIRCVREIMRQKTDGEMPEAMQRKEECGLREAAVTLTVAPNGVIYFEAAPVSLQPDRGYDYERAVRA
ncbi:MAG: glycosyl hydrolase [Eubacteriales bacterium]|nr:glycosyl hydrolase [Eubacteriales bacterium]